MRCGKGTYIRSLARDLGRRFGCGGHIGSLRRLSIGSFTEADALGLDIEPATARERLLPPWRAVQDWPPLGLPAEDIAKLQHGNRVPLPDGVHDDLGQFAVVDNAGRTVAVMEVVDGWLQPVKVLIGADATS